MVVTWGCSVLKSLQRYSYDMYTFLLVYYMSIKTWGKKRDSDIKEQIYKRVAIGLTTDFSRATMLARGQNNVERKYLPT